jgi:hypothetical protein
MVKLVATLTIHPTNRHHFGFAKQCFGLAATVGNQFEVTYHNT